MTVALESTGVAVPAVLQSALQTLLPTATLRRYCLNHCGAIQLWLIDDIGADQPLTEQQTDAVWETPPYWAFCWGSGQSVAQWIAENSEKIAGKTIVDFGSGSGIVAIAAAKAGAARVYALDIDPVSLQAIAANAALNGVELEVVDQLPGGTKGDWLFAADILYDPENLPLLDQFDAMAAQIVIADSRVKKTEFEGYQMVSTMRSVTMPDLGENEDVKQVRLFYRGDD